MVVEFGKLLSMYRGTLTDEQRQELQRRTRQRDMAPSTRDRLEMIRRAAAGWRIPTIACHLGQHEQTVRAWIKVLLARGFDALPNKPRGGTASALTPAIVAAVRPELIEEHRTWTAAHLVAWVAGQDGVRLSTGRLRIPLNRAKRSYHRTSRTVKHKQKPAEVIENQAAIEDVEKQGLPA